MSGLNFDAQCLGLSSKIVRYFSIAIASSLAVGLASCSPDTSPSGTAESPQVRSSPTAVEKLQVITTFVPITNFTKAVAGDRAEVSQLLPTNIGPHDYQAKPEDASRLAKADVLVENGLEMEEFLEDLVKNSGNANLKIVDSSKGVQTISEEEHDRQNHAKGDREKGEEKAEAEHEHGEFNPHIWLDPKRAIQQVENIRDGLIAADPAGKETYRANAAAYIQQLRELDAETAKMLQPYKDKTFVAFHDFAPYFAQSYNLKADFLVDVPEENPSPDDVKRVMDTVKATNLKTLLTEPQSGEDAFAALAKDLKVKVSIFDPMETGGSEALEPSYYITTMRQNVKTLVTAFTGKSPQSFLPIWMPQPVAVVPQQVGMRF